MTSPSPTAELFTLESVVRGHHIYKRVWSPMLGEKLQIEIEEDNRNDARAVAIQKRGKVVDHSPRETAKIVWYLLRRGSRKVQDNWKKNRTGGSLRLPFFRTR